MNLILGQTLWSAKIRSHRERIKTANGRFQYHSDAVLKMEYIQWTVERVTPRGAWCRSSDLRRKWVGAKDQEVATTREGACLLASEKRNAQLLRLCQSRDMRYMDVFESPIFDMES